jgi:AAHS family 4-hydroxybenzoate transporter-like MFS transporter
MAVVLSRSYLLGSVMLWLAYGMGIVIFYAMISWMPVLFKDAGIDQRNAVLISSLFPLGGVGAIALGWLMDRCNPNRVVMTSFLVAALLIYLIGKVVGDVTLLILLVFLGGTAMCTSQASLPALAAAFYPTSGRATGVAWMMAVGRIGAAVGPFLVAELQHRQMSFEQIFTVLAIPALISAAALFVKNLFHLKAASETPSVVKRPLSS